MSQKKHKNLQNIQSSTSSNENQNWYDQVLVSLLFLTVPSLIFAHTIQVYSVFTAPKLFLLRILTLLMILTISYKFWSEQKIKIISPTFYVFLGLYAFVSILNSVWSVNIYDSLHGVPGRFMGLFTRLDFLVLAFLTTQILSTKKVQRNFVIWLVGFGFLSALHGYLQYKGIFGDPSNWDQDPTKRVFGSFGHANHYAAFLGMIASLSLGLFFSTKNKVAKGFYIITGLLGLLTLLATASRGGLIAFIVAIMFFIIISFYLFYKKINLENDINNFCNFLKFIFVKYKKTSITILSSAFVALILILIFQSTLIQKINNSFFVERFRILQSTYEQGLVPDRISWSLSMIDMIKDKPLLGYGLSTFKDIFNSYRRLDYRDIDDLQYEVTPEFGHMEYLSIASTQGLIGLLTYLLPIVYIFYLSFKHFKNEQNQDNYFLLGLLAACVVYITQVLVSFGVIETFSLFFIFLGLSAAYLSKEQIEEKITGATKHIILIISFLLFIFGMLYSINRIKVEFWLRQAQVAEITAKYDHAISSYTRILELEPNNATYYSNYADLLFRLSENPEFVDNKEEFLKASIQNYEEAIARNTWLPHLYSNVGLSALHLANFYKNTDNKLTSEYLFYSVESYEKAANKGTNNPLHLYNLMKIYGLIGQFDKSYEIGEKILKIRLDYKDTFSVLIQFAELAGNTEKAKEYAKRAYEAFPNNPEYEKMYEKYFVTE